MKRSTAWRLAAVVFGIAVAESILATGAGITHSFHLDQNTYLRDLINIHILSLYLAVLFVCVLSMIVGISLVFELIGGKVKAAKKKESE